MLVVIYESGKLIFWDDVRSDFSLSQSSKQRDKKDNPYSNVINPFKRELSERRAVNNSGVNKPKIVSIFQYGKLLKFTEIERRVGFSRRTLNRRIEARLWTKPVRISANRIAWPCSEVELLIAAYIAGKDDLEIRRLVERLEITRKQPIRRPILR
ncbi:MAG: hypothetical protein K0R12_110 [Gammaproteobacteria bacterium]|jgi:prophage regulatory protein|nr:hypothetical protein [Gammaproteobacteria bacterium]